MGHIVNPYVNRLSISTTWKVAWVNMTKKNYKLYFFEDFLINKIINWFIKLFLWNKKRIEIAEFKYQKIYKRCIINIILIHRPERWEEEPYRIRLKNVWKHLKFNSRSIWRSNPYIMSHNFYFKYDFDNFLRDVPDWDYEFYNLKKWRIFYYKVNRRKFLLDTRHYKFQLRRSLLRVRMSRFRKKIKYRFDRETRKQEQIFETSSLVTYIRDFCRNKNFSFMLNNFKRYNNIFYSLLMTPFLYKNKLFNRVHYFKNNLLFLSYAKRVRKDTVFIFNCFFYHIFKKIFLHDNYSIFIIAKKQFFTQSQYVNRLIRMRLRQHYRIGHFISLLYRRLLIFKEDILGIKIRYAGRYQKRLRNKKIKFERGRLSIGSVSAPLSYHNFFIILKQGICGVKFYINIRSEAVEIF